MNPMGRFAEVYRDLLYHLRFPGLDDVVYLVACAALAMLIGLMAFRRLDGRLAEEL
jgi:ABC-2 type transport system permease protein